MRLNSAKQCRHCVCGAYMGACARHLSHISQHRRFDSLLIAMWLNASYNPVKLDV